MREDIITSRNGANVEISIAKAISPAFYKIWFTNCQARYVIAMGARNTGKSKTLIGYASVMKIISNEKRNVLVFRKNDIDNRDSTFKNICNCIEDLGFTKYFTITKQPMEITYKPTGQKIIFKGANNPTSITSIEGITDIFIEEAWEIADPETFRILDGSIRAKMPKGIKLQITMCLNGWSDTHWIYHTFFKGRLEDDVNMLESKGYQFYYDPEYIGPYGTGLALMKSAYTCNPWRDVENYDRSMEEMKRLDYDRYKVEALGCWGKNAPGCYPAFNDSCLISIQDALKLPYMIFAIGVDTGLSTAEGKQHKVGKDESPEMRVRAATVMTLMGITPGYGSIIILDEYYHSNIKSFFSYNTDKDIHPGAMTQPELMAYMCVVLQEWRKKYESYVGKPRTSSLFSGMVDVFFDSADLGGRQTMELESRKQGMHQVRFFGGGKLSIRARVDFENALQHYGNFLVCKENCPNTIREFKNAVMGEHGEARADTDDHCLTSAEYSFTPYWTDLIQRHNFKPH